MNEAENIERDRDRKSDPRSEDPQSEEPRGDQPKSEISEADEKLLKQIREDYRYCRDYWREVREEAATDMQFVAGNPWTADDLKERENRPCLTPDELSQYLKQANNNRRQNKRAIQVNPRGLGATDEDARMRAAIIRGIEYQSNAQAAYTTAFEQSTSCGFGFFRLSTKQMNERGEVLPVIKRIPNQFSVLMDPNAREADFSDMELCFVQDVMRTSKFAEAYPDAVKRSFSHEDMLEAPDWLDGENLVVAEYWTRQGKTVTQHITNGLEILETNKWDGSWIPVIPVLGEEIYVQTAGKSKRMFMSLIRRARTPQKMLAYIASQEAEEFGMSPRVPYLIWEGQEQADSQAWKNANKVPRAYLKIKPVVEPTTNTLLPPPTRQPFVPNAEAYEMARESWRRAIQAAMGTTPLPTAAQRQNEKSGIALDKIQTQEAVGSFHFTDNFDRALENCGRQLNELITKVMDTPRQVGIRNPDDSHELLHVTSAAHQDKLQLPEDTDDYLITDRGEFDVTVGVGPNFASERDRAADFADTLLGELQGLPVPPQIAQLLLAKAVKLKNIGPLGDEIADLLTPPNPDEIPPQAQAAIAQAQGVAQQLQQELAKMTMERDAKVLDHKARLELERMKQTMAVEMEKLRLENQLAMAEINTKAQSIAEREAFVRDMWKEIHSAAHEIGLQAHQHQHEATLAENEAQIAAETQAQAQGAEAQPTA